MSRTSYRLLALTAGMLFLIGCTPPSASPTADSGVTGRVLIGPQCGVQPEGDTSCDDKPYVTSVDVFRDGWIGAPTNVVMTAPDGTYRIVLAPGAYTVQARGGNPLPTCDRQLVTVTGGAFASLTLHCDTGIR